MSGKDEKSESDRAWLGDAVVRRMLSTPPAAPPKKRKARKTAKRAK